MAILFFSFELVGGWAFLALEASDLVKATHRRRLLADSKS